MLQKSKVERGAENSSQKAEIFSRAPVLPATAQYLSSARTKLRGSFLCQTMCSRVRNFASAALKILVVTPKRLCSTICCHKQTKVRPRSYFGLRGNGMNPSRFGILTLGSDCASITSFDPTIPLRLRI